MTLQQRLDKIRQNRKRSEADPARKAGQVAELEVAETLRTRLKDTGFSIAAGVRVPDFDGARRREFDFIITTPTDVILIELKNWSGRLALEGDRFIQHRRNDEIVDHGAVLLDLDAKQRTFTNLLKRRGNDIPPTRSVLLFHNPKLEVDAEFSNVGIEILTRSEFLSKLPDSRKTILEMLWEFIETLLGTSAGRRDHSAMRPSDAIRQTRVVLDSLGTWDVLHLHGGQVLAGDILWVETRTSRLSDRDQVANISVHVSRSYVSAIFGAFGNFRENCVLKVRSLTGQHWETEAPLDGVACFHAAGSRTPDDFHLRQLENISYGYTNSASQTLTWDNIAANDVHLGRVKNVCNFGVFMDIGAPTDALLHISEVDEDHRTSPEELPARFPRGSELQVRVLDVDRDKERISLALA